jgi:hypothetical protein
MVAIVIAAAVVSIAAVKVMEVAEVAEVTIASIAAVASMSTTASTYGTIASTYDTTVYFVHYHRLGKRVYRIVSSSLVKLNRSVFLIFICDRSVSKATLLFVFEPRDP